MRDAQKGRVHKAEREVFPLSWNAPQYARSKTFMDITTDLYRIPGEDLALCHQDFDWERSIVEEYDLDEERHYLSPWLQARTDTFEPKHGRYGARWGDVRGKTLAFRNRYYATKAIIYLFAIEVSVRAWRKLCEKYRTSGVWLNSHPQYLSPVTQPLKVVGRSCRTHPEDKLEITLPLRHITRPGMLHELAHSLVSGNTEDEIAVQYNAHPGALQHGWMFCRAYLDLVKRFHSDDAHNRLRQAFRDNKVRYNPRRKRPMSDAQKAAGAQRLEAWREAQL
jgi:hypothetical protein